MHTFGDSGAGVPAFLAKLWRLVDDPETNDLICWSKDGRSFVIQNQAKFARELLPLNYKHNNMASFIRQLNMYGFHKISSIENGGLKFDRDEMEFSHPCFKRNHPYLLEHIKRKIATTKNTDEKTALKPEAVSKVLQDVRAMRGRQDSLDSRFSVMKQENEALWREIASLRQKHAKQQQIVNKLIQFLITIVQPSRNMTGVKRTMHLMINDTPENAKLRKSSESESEAGGPVIHELGEELLDEVADTVGALYNNDECASPAPLHMERPHSSISMTSQNYDYSNQSTEDLLNQMPGTPQSSNGGGSAGVGTPSTGAGSKVPPAVIQSIHSDGSQVVYHVTEIPDAHPPLTPSPQLPVNDDNILQTPMVREEIARSQLLLKQKQSRRRKNTTSPQDAGAASAANGGNNSKPTTAKLPRLQEPIKQEQQQLINHQPIQVKSEQNLDPMQFLNVYTDSYLDSPAGTPQQPQQLMSPMLNDDSQQSRQSLCYSGGAIPSPAPSPLAGNMSVMVGGQGGKTITTAADATSSTAATNNLNNTLGLYTSDFIDNDIPSDIFEDSILSAAENSNNSNFNGKLKSQQQQQQQQQAEENFLLSTLNNGKFSAFAAANSNGNGNGNGQLHRNGSSQNATGGKNMEADDNAGPSTSSAVNSLKNDDDNEQNMAVTQYKRSGSVAVPENMRNEVHGHLDSLQDELDTLKELLRGDNYSLDNNMLMSLSKAGVLTEEMFNSSLKKSLEDDILTKLFNDSDILGPYGLQMPMDGGPNEKKGSELIPAYQPSYDLSDIMSINNDSNLDAGDVDVASPSSSNMARSNSVLNTPYHE